MILVHPVALDHSAAEILELVGNAARDDKKQHIVRSHLQLVICKMKSKYFHCESYVSN